MKLDLKSIPGFPGYAITKCGKVWSEPKEWVFGRGGKNSHNGKWLKTARNNCGYHVVGLRRDRRSTTCLVHKLVMLTYEGETPEGLEVDHIDRDLDNNHFDNLRYVTSSQNGANRANVKGYWQKKPGKWGAQISCKNKTIHLGYFYSEEEAQAAHRRARKELHGC